MKEYRPGDPAYDIFPPEKGAGDSGSTAPMQRGVSTLPPDPDFSAWDPSWSARRRGRAVARTITERTAGLEILRKYHDAAEAFEQSYQRLLAAQTRRAQIPLIAEAAALALMEQIEKGRGALQAAIDLNGDLRARRLERRELEGEVHELEMLRKRRLILEERLAIERLEGKLAKDDEPAAADSHDGDPLGDYLKTEAEVRRARSEAARVADTIRNAAAAEGRDLTPQEQELLDMYESAAASAEENIRRGGAADF